MATTDEVLPYLKELTEATNEGRIVWKGANPTTYVWETDSPTPARITVQHVARQERVAGALRTVHHYYFQLIDRTNNSIRLSMMSSRDQPAIHEALRQLFVVASGGITNAGLDFLKNVVPKK